MNGLPFAGIPSELQAGVEKLLETEPEWETPDPKFSYRDRESGVTLRKMLGAHRRMLTISIFLVIVEASMLQTGPLLTQIGIDKGISESDWGVLLACAIGSLVCVGLTIVASRFRVSLTGKFSSRIMFDLRVRVFAHLQRLSLDYYTDEKAGVIMTRMTSDVEALQQMLQEGLVQFAVQGLTMLVVTVILFFYSVHARAHHAGPHRARAHDSLVVVPRARPTVDTTRCATASPACSATCRRACRAFASSSGSTACATT